MSIKLINVDSPTQLRETLLRYRLRELDEDERANIDALLIADADYFAAFQEAEYDLLDAYAANELTPAQRTRVEQALHPHTRVTSNSFQPQPTFRTPAKPSTPIPIPTRARTLPLWMPIAAALFIATLVGVAWNRRTHPAPQINATTALHNAHAPAESPSPTQPSPTQPSPTQPGPTQPRPTQPTPTHPTPLIATLLLPPTTRSQAALAVTLTPATRTLTVSWPRPANDPTTSRYQLQILTSTGILATTIAGKPRGQLIDFPCPARTIPSGSSFFRVISQPANPANLVDREAPPLLETTVTISRP